MIRIFLPFLPLSLLSGCIIYDSTAKCGHGMGTCAGGEETGYLEDTSGLEGEDSDDTDTAGDDSGAVEPDATFALDPSEATAGDTFIASLTAENFDLDTVTRVRAFGPVELLASASRDGELLLTFSVDFSAEEGETADLLLEIGEDDAEYLPGVLLLHAYCEESGSGGGGCS